MIFPDGTHPGPAVYVTTSTVAPSPWCGCPAREEVFGRFL